MDWGMRNRLSRFIKADTGRCLMLAVDHGYFLGPTRKLENPKKTIAPLIEHADALMPTRGVLRNCVDPAHNTPIVLRVSGGTSVLKEDLSDEAITTTMEEAVRMNVSAVALSIFVGSEHEKQTLISLSKLVSEGERYGIPVLAVTAVGKDMARDVRYLALASRIASELGAHVVKTYYCDDFEKLTESCPVPVVIAGGKALETPLDVFEMTYNAVTRGAVGVDMGRNIWQSDQPVAMIRSVRKIVHETAKPEEALDFFETLVAEQP